MMPDPADAPMSAPKRELRAANKLARLDRLTTTVLQWTNNRRAYVGLDPLEDLRDAGALADDPITASMPPGSTWCIGRIQYWHQGSLVQVETPDYIHRWLAEWRAGKHDY